MNHNLSAFLNRWDSMSYDDRVALLTQVFNHNQGVAL